MEYKEQTISSCYPSLFNLTPNQALIEHKEQSISPCYPSLNTTVALSATQTVEKLFLMCEVTSKPVVTAKKFITLYKVTKETSKAALPPYITSLTASTASEQVATAAVTARENSQKISKR